MRKLHAYFKANPSLILGWIAGFFLVMQVMNLHSYVVRAVESQSIVATTDDDASWNIAKTVKTRWWKDNGWVLYGPAYFRLNHTIQYFLGRTADSDTPVNASENWEKTAHHTILTTSLLSVFALTFLIGFFLFKEWWQRFLFSSALSSALLSIPSWAEFVLRAHPDHLMNLVMVAAFILTIRMFQEKGKKVWTHWSAILWGIGMSVKMSLVMCAPGFLFLFIPPVTKENFKRGLRYLGIMFAAYFLIGFPQTIVIDRPYRSFKTLNSISAPADLASVQRWLNLYVENMVPAFLILFLAWICFWTERQKISREGLLRLGVFAVLPFILLLQKNMLVVANHYVQPYLSVLLVFVGLLLTQLPSFRPGRYPYWRFAIFATVFLAGFGATPKEMQTQLEKFSICRAESREALKKLKELYAAGEKIWVDPYMPYIAGAPKDRQEISWEKGWPAFTSGGWTVLALRETEIGRYLPEEPDPYTRSATPNWPEIRKFYLPFGNGATEVTVPDGRVFKKIYSNSCGQQIWKP